MDLSPYLAGGIVSGGYLLNNEGRQPREVKKIRKKVPKSEIPSGKNIYHSTRWKKVRSHVQDVSADSYRKSLDPYNKNIIPPYFNVLGAKTYIDDFTLKEAEYSKSGKKRRSAVNQGGIELDIIDKSPMFNPLRETKLPDTRVRSSDHLFKEQDGIFGRGIVGAIGPITHGTVGLSGKNGVGIRQKGVSPAPGQPAPIDPSPRPKGRPKRKTFINETGGDQEMDISESPIFKPLGRISEPVTSEDLGFGPKDYRTRTLTGGSNPISQGGVRENFQNAKVNKNVSSMYDIANRSPINDYRPTKQEHFSNFTIHGPQNSNDPNVHSNMVPFFGGKATQNMDPLMHQQRLERYTGQTNSVTELRSQAKTELPLFFKEVPNQTFIHGTPVDNLERNQDRYIASNLKQKVAPAEEIRVGPGLNYGYDAQPQDGFHPMYRPDFRNIDTLRVNPKNVYRGRILSGKNITSNRGLLGRTYKRRPDTFYLLGPSRWNVTTGSYTGPKVRENFKAYTTNREWSNVDYTGIAGNTQIMAPKPTFYLEGNKECLAAEGDYTDKSDPSCLAVNQKSIHGAVQHTLKNQFRQAPPRNFFLDGPAHPKFDYSMSSYTAYGEERDTTERPLGAQRLNTFINQGPKKYLYDDARTTTRQTAYVKDYQGQANTKTTERPIRHPYDDARTTTRQTMNVKDYQGQAQTKSTERPIRHPYDDARTTTRQTAYVKDYQGQAQTKSTERPIRHPYDDARTTTRQTMNVKDYQGQAQTKATERQVTHPYDDARTTTRQTTYVKDYQGTAGTKEIEHQVTHPYDDARTTTRQTTYVKDYQGTAGTKEIERQVTHPYDDARTTTRQTVYVKDYQGISGATDQTRLPQSYQDMYNATTKNTQEDILAGRIYGPNKNTNIAIGSADINMQITSRTGYDITKYKQNPNKLYTSIPAVEVNYNASTSQGNRDVEGIRQPATYLTDQHQKNPYTQSLQSATPLT